MSRHPTPRIVLPLILIALIAAGCARPRSDADPTADPPASALRFIFAEQTAGTTSIWAANPEEPADRRLLLRIPHDPAWGIRASLAPDGRALAFTAMPRGARDPDRDAALTTTSLVTGRSRRLASGLDLRTTPLWLADSSALVAQRRTATGTGVLVLVSADGEERPLADADAGHRLFPVAVHRHGVYVADIGPDGARLWSVGPAAPRRLIVDLDGAVVRGFALSPDGSTLAYLRLTNAGDATRYRARAVDLTTGRTIDLRQDVTRAEDTGLTWTEAGVALSVVFDHGGGALLLPSHASDQPRESGFDALIAIGEAGGWLAVRAFDSGDSHRPGTESLVLIAPDRRRVNVTSLGATGIGWAWL